MTIAWQTCQIERIILRQHRILEMPALLDCPQCFTADKGFCQEPSDAQEPVAPKHDKSAPSTSITAHSASVPKAAVAEQTGNQSTASKPQVATRWLWKLSLCAYAPHTTA